MAAPRSVDQRIVDTRQRLEHDVDAWVATTSPDRPWLIPLSFLWHEHRLQHQKPPGDCMNELTLRSSGVSLDELKVITLLEPT